VFDHQKCKDGNEIDLQIKGKMLGEIPSQKYKMKQQ
jgi:hypothetical protein